jgi:hypothetical protein
VRSRRAERERMDRAVGMVPRARVLRPDAHSVAGWAVAALAACGGGASV